MRIIVLIIIAIGLFPNLTFAQRDSSIIFGEEEIEVEYYFGFNLIPNAMGALYHLALIKPQKNGSYKAKQLTREGFVAQASGLQYSDANPKGIDFFKKYNIEKPVLLIESLWKLRYKEFPYHTNDKMEPGWSTNDSIPFLPSPSQMKTLGNFGMFHMRDYIYGENAFRLLQFMSRPEWVKLYKESY
jgi:hypothetical protein